MRQELSVSEPQKRKPGKRKAYLQVVQRAGHTESLGPSERSPRRGALGSLSETKASPKFRALNTKKR